MGTSSRAYRGGAPSFWMFTDTVPEALTTATSKASPASRDRVCPSVVLRTVYSIKNWLSFPVRLPLKVGAEHPGEKQRQNQGSQSAAVK